MSWRTETSYFLSINKTSEWEKNTLMQKDKCSGKSVLMLPKNSADLLRKSAEDDPFNCLYLYCRQTTTEQQRCEETLHALQESSGGYTELQNQWKCWDLKRNGRTSTTCCAVSLPSFCSLISYWVWEEETGWELPGWQHCPSWDFYIRTVAAPCCHRTRPHQPVRRFCWGTWMDCRNCVDRLEEVSVSTEDTGFY